MCTITTLLVQELYESDGDAEAFGVHSILYSFQGVVTIILLSEILNLLVTLNTFMQRKCAVFARLQVVVLSNIQELKSCRLSYASWCNSIKETITKLETDHGTEIGSLPCTTRRTRSLAEETSDIQHF